MERDEEAVAKGYDDAYERIRVTNPYGLGWYGQGVWPYGINQWVTITTTSTVVPKSQPPGNVVLEV
jgi:hypothetical protein